MNCYTLVKGFETHAEAQEYADRLPPHAIAKVVPYGVPRRNNGGRSHLFAVDVSRWWTNNTHN